MLEVRGRTPATPSQKTPLLYPEALEARRGAGRTPGSLNWVKGAGSNQKRSKVGRKYAVAVLGWWLNSQFGKGGNYLGKNRWESQMTFGSFIKKSLERLRLIWDKIQKKACSRKVEPRRIDKIFRSYLLMVVLPLYVYMHCLEKTTWPRFRTIYRSNKKVIHQAVSDFPSLLLLSAVKRDRAVHGRMCRITY